MRAPPCSSWPVLRCGIHIVAAALLMLLTTVATAAPPPPLDQTEEARALRLARGSPGFARYWLGYVQPFQFAANTLRRSALLSRCKAFSSGIDSLNSAQRQAVERILIAQESLWRSGLGPIDGPVRNRIWLANVALMSPLEREALLSLAEGAVGDLAMRAVSEATVMEHFHGLSRDPGTDRVEPAAAIWLTGFFDASGRRDALRRAVSREAPELLPDLDRMTATHQLAPEDAVWLSQITHALASRSEAIKTQLLSEYPSHVLDEAQRLSDFHWRVTASEVPAMTPPGSPQWEVLREAADSLYPEPPGARDLKYGNGLYLPARAELPQFCSEPKAASSP